MAAFIKTYITDAPWRSILFSGLFFTVFAGGINLLVRSINTGGFFTGYWYLDLIMWFTVGVFSRYFTWRAQGHLERKNKKWTEKRSGK